MNYPIFSMLAAVSLLVCLSACDKPDTQTETSVKSASSLATLNPATTVNDESSATDNVASTDKWSATDAWAGQWYGPEGTFLRIDGKGGNYELTIQNLDGPLKYTGVGIGEKIQFERNGIKETIHATNGEDTGMKWLSDKSDCLTIRVGEGYCKK
jgi:hypothetical protein